MKLFLFFINSIYWLWAFAVPVIVSGLPAWYLYEKAHKNLPWSVLLLIAGVVAGVITAEAIRRKYGLVNFFSRLSATPDLDKKEETPEKSEVS
jgi:hypothetical protein